MPFPHCMDAHRFAWVLHKTTKYNKIGLSRVYMQKFKLHTISITTNLSIFRLVAILESVSLHSITVPALVLLQQAAGLASKNASATCSAGLFLELP